LQKPTSSEDRLDKALDRLRKIGYEFIREECINGFYPDFYQPQAKLIIEVDGAVHEGLRYEDARREGLLRMSDYQIKRYSAERVMKESEIIVAEIHSWLRKQGMKPLRRRSGTAKLVVAEVPKGDISHLPVHSDLVVVVPTSPVVAKPSKVPKKSVAQTPKGRYICTNCPGKGEFVAELGSPRCFGCNRNDGTRLLCNECGRPFIFTLSEPSRSCQNCRGIREVSRNAARGQRDDMTPIAERSGGRILKTNRK
jgi:very-short-patch-repair endonuclease